MDDEGDHPRRLQLHRTVPERRLEDGHPACRFACPSDCQLCIRRKRSQHCRPLCLSLSVFPFIFLSAKLFNVWGPRDLRESGFCQPPHPCSGKLGVCLGGDQRVEMVIADGRSSFVLSRTASNHGHGRLLARLLWARSAGGQELMVALDGIDVIVEVAAGGRYRGGRLSFYLLPLAEPKKKKEWMIHTRQPRATPELRSPTSTKLSVSPTPTTNTTAATNTNAHHGSHHSTHAPLGRPLHRYVTVGNPIARPMAPTTPIAPPTPQSSPSRAWVANRSAPRGP